jgi:hypothetical protein
MKTQNTARVHKHRDKLITEDSARIEVTLQRDLIRQARDLAQQNGHLLSHVVAAALIEYVDGHAAESGNEATNYLHQFCQGRDV